MIAWKGHFAKKQSEKMVEITIFNLFCAGVLLCFVAPFKRYSPSFGEVKGVFPTFAAKGAFPPLNAKGAFQPFAVKSAFLPLERWYIVQGEKAASTIQKCESIVDCQRFADVFVRLTTKIQIQRRILFKIMMINYTLLYVAI